MVENTTTKNITTVEELTTLTGTEKVFVSSNGTIKQIAPENAKFGGGTATYYYCNNAASAAASATYLTMYKDGACSEPVSILEFMDAIMSGPVWGLLDVWINIDMWYALDSSAQLTLNPSDAVFVKCGNAKFDSVHITIGTYPA